MRAVGFLVLAAVHFGGSAAENRFGVVKATKTPCCVDTLLPGVCRALYNRNHVQFTTRCRTLPDFSFIQCCHSCHFNDNLYTGKGLPVATDLYRRDAEEMLLKPDTFKCFDRHGSQFCEAFAAKLSSWTRTGFTCQHTALAFRICRRTCGYCSGNLNATVPYVSDEARDLKKCHRLF